MKSDKLRIKIEFIINIILSAIEILGGIGVIFCCIQAFGEFGDEFDSSLDNPLLMIFALPLILLLYCVIAVIMFIIGIIPALMGVITGALTLLARFKFSEDGCTVTKPYKILMTTVYIVYSVAVTGYAVVFITGLADYYLK